MSQEDRQHIIEAALFAAAEPLTSERLQQLFEGGSQPTLPEIKQCIADLNEACQERGVEIQQVASGYRFQAKACYAPWLQRLWEKRPPRYTRALLETLALIAYRQPATRGEIEEVRGVAVSADIIKKLTEREWIKVVGYRDVPGKPAMFGTTKKFLDYFNLKSLSSLPPLQELVDLDQIEKQLNEQLVLEVGDGADQLTQEIEEVMENDLDRCVADASDDEIVEEACDAAMASVVDASEEASQAEQIAVDDLTDEVVEEECDATAKSVIDSNGEVSEEEYQEKHVAVAE